MQSHLGLIARTVPRRIAIGIIVGTVAVATLLAGTGTVHAQLMSTFTTNAPVSQGGTMSIAVTSPAGALITTVSSIPCTPTTTLPAATVTFSCTNAGGLPAGTVVQQTFSVASGPINETVTYNANGPAAASPAATAAPGTSPSCTSSAPNFTCFVTLAAPTVPGGTLTITVTPAALQTVLATPGSISGCPLTTAFPTSASSSAVTATYTCAAGQTIPGGSVFVTVTTAGSATAPTIAAVTNANNPTGLPAIPAPSTQSVTATGGSATLPTISSIDPPFGSGGTPVTINGNNLTNVSSINFNGTPGSSVNCTFGGTTCSVIAPSFPTGTVANVTVVTLAGTSAAVSFAYGGIGPGPIIGPGGFFWGPPPPPSALIGANTINLASGWNLIGAANGASLNGAPGPLYTFQGGTYQTVGLGTALTPGLGYWAYLPVGGSLSIPVFPLQPQSIPLPPAQWVMVGNPSSSPVQLSGADVAYTYSPSVGSYQQTFQLGPGQGAWVLSLGGGVLTMFAVP